MKNEFRHIVIKLLTNTVGRLFVFISPKKARELSAKGMTLVMNNNLSTTERLMRSYMLQCIEKEKDFERLSKFHKNYWVNQGSDFFQSTDTSFENDFLPNCSFIFNHLEEQLKTASETFDTIVEIGTGNGKVLHYLSERFSDIKFCIGIDLSAEQIAVNTEKYKTNNKLNFIEADALEWVKQKAQAQTIFVTSRGVLEYFTEEDLNVLLEKIYNLGQVIFVAIEPNGINHDFNKNPESELYGQERSFSHNYSKVFKEIGYSIWHYSSKPSVKNSFNQTFLGAKN
ncbi:class I SAM-dependent methyltransferase [uncultured Winogradskyella sp.]|uniref:class I SAM-dependent methyltransferase n=1 Tax=uncultured Winogradskyella sp. TaxID=395353 RepID=UPI0030D830BC|tara:strand:+ start:5650 stop:6501 length:852 start_codon:yes stop_codon:yes gene_type:complete